MLTVSRKLLHGVTTALAGLAGARLALLVLGLSPPDLAGLVIRVGVPAFVVGVLFFPVRLPVLERRWSLGWRVLLAAITVGVCNRLMLKGDFSRLTPGDLPRRIADLVPDPAALDGNAKLIVLACVSSVAVAWLLQPLVLWAVRPLASRASQRGERLAMREPTSRTPARVRQSGR